MCLIDADGAIEADIVFELGDRKPRLHSPAALETVTQGQGGFGNAVDA